MFQLFLNSYCLIYICANELNSRPMTDDVVWHEFTFFLFCAGWFISNCLSSRFELGIDQWFLYLQNLNFGDWTVIRIKMLFQMWQSRVVLITLIYSHLLWNVIISWYFPFWKVDYSSNVKYLLLIRTVVSNQISYWHNVQLKLNYLIMGCIFTALITYQV